MKRAQRELFDQVMSLINPSITCPVVQQGVEVTEESVPIKEAVERAAKHQIVGFFIEMEGEGVNINYRDGRWFIEPCSMGGTPTVLCDHIAKLIVYFLNRRF